MESSNSLDMGINTICLFLQGHLVAIGNNLLVPVAELRLYID
jgi:hypothetical protein